MTARIIQSDLGTILDAMAARLVAKSVVAGPAAVLLIAKGQPPPDTFSADRVVMLRPMRRRIVQEIYAGVGRQVKLTRFVTVYTRLEYAGDKDLSDSQWLRKTDAFEVSVLNAFLDWFPQDITGNSLVTDGLLALDGSEMVKSADDVWGDSLVSYQINYLPRMDYTIIG